MSATGAEEALGTVVKEKEEERLGSERRSQNKSLNLDKFIQYKEALCIATSHLTQTTVNKEC